MGRERQAAVPLGQASGQQRSLDFEQWEPLEGFRVVAGSDQIVTVKVSSVSRGLGSWEWKDGERPGRLLGCLSIHSFLPSPQSTALQPCVQTRWTSAVPSPSASLWEKDPRKVNEGKRSFREARMAQWSRA